MSANHQSFVIGQSGIMYFQANSIIKMIKTQDRSEVGSVMIQSINLIVPTKKLGGIHIRNLVNFNLF